MHASKLNLRLDTWVMRHIQVALASLGRLCSAPLATFMTTAVIGIALALPTGMHVALSNIQQLAGSWEGSTTLSLFLKQDIGQEQAEKLTTKLRNSTKLEEVQLINPDLALEEFRRLSGFDGAIEVLDKNPLPTVLIIKPQLQYSTPEAAEQLTKEFDQLAEVEFTQLDLQWVRRFHAITEIAQRSVVVIGILLGLAVLLIVGNTIRLEIQNRHSEIEITKLIGGTDAFIRRPFLYNGLWYGLSGGIFAWLLVTLSLWLLNGPVERLAGLYHSSFNLSAIDFQTLGALLLISTLLGLFGSWIAVGRHLSDIEPV
ncbi:Cell-division-associated, ABC-transporter-like signaling protein FtsX [hydrothermal vent metagenome]|uniref:Cell division protein FtsX n=1 Tax=hydrothermal vent metagenome TaxID=652676 RepID=A0A3B1C349_9ZZZZ